ncbi:transmembrane protein, putative (macronuclear) [Tetrahymena thermophila SB210]|uniref:Transmembrane protein, putative n=1 Tax=Tetrahymena thermophila (strain SB210) TaxID=312017 RepID=Q22X49_TETTS|nr:transmembrane protein, putative [Tetrahymena thermophila SB210]EAR89797.2 transmembrane protein, putative [Tetrahymena thermophila SB210]|eukprot:XP_001010042.2 transmembrane protein, putative [Tetrahymena thermophila SB210]
MIDYLGLNEEQNSIPTLIFESQNISINQFDLSYVGKYNQYSSLTVVTFQGYSQVYLKTLNLIQVKDLQQSLLQFCSYQNSQRSQQVNVKVNIDQINIQKIFVAQKKVSASSIFTGLEIKPVLFDLNCDDSTEFLMQNVQIKRIDVFSYNVRYGLLLISNSGQSTLIDSIVFHDSKDQKVQNLWNSYGMFVFYDSQNLGSSLQINNIELPQINYISGQNGIISVDRYKSVLISNINITSSQYFQSYQGGLITVNNANNVSIFNISAIIYPSCQFKSMFGGLIHVQASLNTNISNFYFNYQNQFSDEVQHSGNQGGILYIYGGDQSIINLSHIYSQGLLSSSADGAFSYLQCQSALLQDIYVSNFTSLKNGGAFFLDCAIQMNRVLLLGNKSLFAGGAIFGGKILPAQEVFIKENESLFGGGIYLMTKKIILEGIIFENNLALIKGNDVCKFITDIKITQIAEYNQYLEPPYQIKKYTFKNEFDQGDYQTDRMYNGLTYFAAFSVKLEGELDWILDIKNPNVIIHNLNDLTPIVIGQDIFNQIPIQATQTIPLKINKLFFSFSLQYESTETQFYGLFTLFNTSYIDYLPGFIIESNITSNCSNGMIQQTFKKSQYCQYCLDSVIYQNNANKIATRCLSCSKDYFDSCYADYSSLKQGFWRQNLTVDSSQIFPCSISRSNCLGGNKTGDFICAEGHIGVECSECDLYNKLGNGSYSRKNLSQCTKCENISNNIIKIISLLILVFIVILIIFKTNFRQQKNYIYKKYLSDMKIIYLGKSYYRLGQSGSYIKILSFYFQIINISSYFNNDYGWTKAFSFQYGLYNPVADSFFSFDCFLSKINENPDSIMYKKMAIVTLTPFCIVFICIIPSLLKKFFSKSSIKNFQYSASLIISYGFTNLFCIPVIDVLTSGMLCRTFNNGQSYSILDFNIECNNTNRLVFLFSFVVPFILVYSIIIPGILFYLLYKNRENLDKISFRFLLGFLYADFKQKFYYWEYLRFILKLILIMTVYSFLSFIYLIGFVSLAALILYLIFLVKKYPYITKKLNEMEIKSIVIGSLLDMCFNYAAFSLQTLRLQMLFMDIKICESAKVQQIH